jgi:hypothetical protein
LDIVSGSVLRRVTDNAKKLVILPAVLVNSFDPFLTRCSADQIRKKVPSEHLADLLLIVKVPHMIALDFRWYVVEDLFPKSTFLHGVSAAAWGARVDEFPGKILSLSRSPNILMGTEE